MSGRLRITGGVFGRRLIAVPPAADRGDVRPTSDRAREAMFSVLASRAPLAGGIVLDVFAGSGALGLEAISRGAAAATFIERDRGTAKTLRANVETLGVTAVCTVVEQDALRGLAGLAPKTFDVVFADPPYALDVDDGVLDALFARVASTGTLLLERGKTSPPPKVPVGAHCEFDRTWGQSRVFLYSHTQ